VGQQAAQVAAMSIEPAAPVERGGRHRKIVFAHGRAA
jgi:hypothetical protein